MSPRRAKRISEIEWGLLLGAVALVDLTQIILDIFVIGVGVNRFIDIAVGMTLTLYVLLRGIGEPRMYLLLGVSFVGEEIPLLDAAPFWSFDVWKIRSWVNERYNQEQEG